MRHFAKDILLGLSVADALGVPAEFKSRQQLSQEPVTDMLGFGTHNQPAGTWSDDSSLAFCLADSLTKGYNLSDIAQKMIAWSNAQIWTPRGKVFDIGIRTGAALNRLSLLVKQQQTLEPIPKSEARSNDNGNGSLMRMLPLCLSLHRKPTLMRYQIVDEVSSLTHPHERSVIACFLYLEYALALIDGADKYGAYRQMQQSGNELLPPTHPEAPTYHRLLKGNIYELPESDIKSTGYVVDCLEAALWCLLNTDNYAQAALQAVNLGNDTDTTACVTGGLAGLLYTYQQIPEAWLHQLARYDDIIQLADQLQKYYNNRG